MIAPAPPRVLTCSFCARTRDQVAALFISRLGGTRPAICSDCAADCLAELALVHREAAARDATADTTGAEFLP